MKEVLAGRQEQLREAIERNKQSQEECRLQKIDIERDIEKSKIQERQKQEHILAIRQDYSKTLEEQIADLEHRKIAEKTQEKKEYEKEQVR